VETLVTAAILDLVDAKSFARRLRAYRGGGNDVEQQRADLEGKMASLAQRWGEGVIGRVEWDAARAPLQRRLDALAGRSQDAARFTPVDRFEDRSLREAWDTLTLDQRRSIAQAIIERVTIALGVKRGGRFDRKRVKIDYRL
jgi:hypothetical protein